MISPKPNVSAFDGFPPTATEDRAIQGGPLYPPDTVVALAREEALAFWSRGAIRDAEKWGLDVPSACQLVVMAVRHGHYLGAQWCIQGPRGPWAACDAYKVTNHEWIEHAHRHIPVTYYLKFCIAKTGAMLLSVSNHPEGT